MFLRELKIQDAPYMLSWMHDIESVQYLYTDFMKKTLDDCQKFINDSKNNLTGDLHLAITDNSDCYVGTVSLKNIRKGEYAEFAITVIPEAKGMGYAQFAMTEMLSKAKSSMDIKTVYWCVDNRNKRALKFYDKMGYTRIKENGMPETILCLYKSENLIWYCESLR